MSSVIRYIFVGDTSSTTGAGKTGLAFGDFTIKCLTEGGTLTTLTAETITTLGTYQAPSDAAHIRIKEVSSSDPAKGMYEVHLHNTIVAAAGKNLWIMCSASGAAIQPLWIPLYDVPGRVPDALTTNGNMKSGLQEILSTALTETSTGYLAAAFKKFFDKSSPTGTINSLPDAVAGATGGLSIVGSAMALSSAAVQAIWDAATSGLTTVGSIGKYLLDRIIGTLASGTHNPQSGDAYAVVTNGTYGLATTKTAIDAVSTAISNLTNLSSLAYMSGPAVMEIPDSGSVDYLFELVIKDQEGKLVDLDDDPTFTAASPGGTDLSSNLNTVTHPATGRYTVKYTLASNATKQQAMVRADGAISTEARYASFGTVIADTDEATAILAILTSMGLVQAQTDKMQFDGDNYIQANSQKFADNVPVQTSGKLWVLDGSGNAVASAASVAAIGSPMQAGAHVQLATTQDQYAPAKAGDEMALVDNAITSGKVQVAAYSGPATGWIERLDQVWRRFFKKATQTSTQVKTYADDNATVVTTQSVSDDTVTQTQGPST